jgi:hypothetical protein
VSLEKLYDPLELVDEFYTTRTAYSPSDCIQLFVGDFRTCYKQLPWGEGHDIDEPLLILLANEEVGAVESVQAWLSETATKCYTNVGVRGAWIHLADSDDESDESLCG